MGRVGEKLCLRVLTIAGVVAGPARAEIRQHLALYTVEGRDQKQLLREMKTVGPRGSDGTVYQGHTRWQFQWFFESAAFDGGCRLREYTLEVDITITLPLWQERDTARGKIPQWWDRYHANLAQHEDEHRDLVVQAYQRMSEILSGHPPAPDCQTLERAVNRAMERELARLDMASEKLDRATDHGRKPRR